MQSTNNQIDTSKIISCFYGYQWVFDSSYCQYTSCEYCDKKKQQFQIKYTELYEARQFIFDNFTYTKINGKFHYNLCNTSLIQLLKTQCKKVHENYTEKYLYHYLNIFEYVYQNSIQPSINEYTEDYSPIKTIEYLILYYKKNLVYVQNVFNINIRQFNLLYQDIYKKVAFTVKNNQVNFVSYIEGKKSLKYLLGNLQEDDKFVELITQLILEFYIVQPVNTCIIAEEQKTALLDDISQQQDNTIVIPEELDEFISKLPESVSQCLDVLKKKSSQECDENIIKYKKKLEEYTEKLRQEQVDKRNLQTIHTQREDVENALSQLKDSKGKMYTKTDITNIVDNFNKSKEQKSVIIYEIADFELIQTCSSGTTIVNSTIPEIHTLYRYEANSDKIINTRNEFEESRKNSMFSDEEITNSSKQPLYQGVTKQGSPVNFSILTFGMKNLQYMIKQRHINGHNNKKKRQRALKKLIDITTSVAGYISTFNLFVQLLNQTLQYLVEKSVDCIKMINGALTEEINYKQMCELLTTGCRYKETAKMFIKLLDHFYIVEQGHIATKDKIYDKTDVKYFNIYCFWGLLVSEQRDSKLVVNIELLSKMTWDQHLNHIVQADIGFNTEILVQFFETQLIVYHQLMANDRQNIAPTKESYDKIKQVLLNHLSEQQQKALLNILKLPEYVHLE